MRVAIIEDNIVVNIAVFEDLPSALAMYGDKICINADNIRCGIGDTYCNGDFIPNEKTAGSLLDRISALEQKISDLQAQNGKTNKAQ